MPAANYGSIWICPEDLASGVMTQSLLCHSPDVERANPNSDQTLQGAVDVEKSVEVVGIWRAVMDLMRTRARARITA
jgi:hypothetical protein